MESGLWESGLSATGFNGKFALSGVNWPFLAMKRTGAQQSGAAAASPAPGQKS